MPTALWISPVSDLAGVARHILDVARTGIPGWRVVVACPAGPLAEALRALDTEVHTLDVDQPIPKVVADLRRIITDAQPELVHSHLAKADVLLALAAPRDLTLISTEHHVQADQRIFHGNALKAHAKVGMHRARLRRFDQLIAVSDSTKRDLIRHWKPQAPVTVILNGVDRPEIQPERTPGLRLLSLTRLSPEKNVETTLRVFERVRNAHPEATLTVGGTGVEEGSLRALAAELGIADAVDFAGFIDPQEAMAEHDVLLQPSLADNLSYTLLDAVASGMGVAASDIGGNGEILPTRCLAGPKDVEALASVALAQGLHLAERPELSNSIPTVSQMCDEIAAVYAKSGHGAWRLSHNEQLPVEVSVVVPCYWSAADLPQQLDALVSQVDAPPFEVILSDNAGDPALRPLAHRYAESLSLSVVDASAIRGVSHARNVGAYAARGQVVVFCDSDDVATPNWLGEIRASVVAGSTFAAGGLRLDKINPTHVLHTYVGVEEGVTLPAPLVQTPIRYLDYLEFGYGANLAFARDDYLALGGCDEALIGADDVDLCWRAQEAGLEMRYVPEALINYRVRSTPSQIFKQRRSYMHAQVKFSVMSSTLGRPVRKISLKWAAREATKIPMFLIKSRRGSEADQFRAAADAGGRLGIISGLLFYRVLGHP